MTNQELRILADHPSGTMTSIPKEDLKRLINVSELDDERIYSALARMRDAMLKRHPEWTCATVSDVLECVLCLEKDYEALVANAF